LAISVIGATGQDFVVKSGFDYSDVYTSYGLKVREGTIYEYGIAKYGITEVSSSTQGSDTITIPESLNDSGETYPHKVIDFITELSTEFPRYIVPLAVYLDDDTYYYSFNTEDIAITNITQADPTVVTAAGHGLTTGDTVTLADITPMLDASGADRLNGYEFTVTVIDTDTFSLDGIDSTNWAAYSSGGRVIKSLGRTRTYVYVKPEHFATEFSGGNIVDTVRASGSGAGSVLQLGFEAQVEGGALSIQKMDIYVKQGRIL
jgi:hypothetical protein